MSETSDNNKSPLKSVISSESESSVDKATEPRDDVSITKSILRNGLESATEDDPDSHSDSDPTQLAVKRRRNALDDKVVGGIPLPLIPLPDSERVQILLPEKVDLLSEHLFFVNRDESMKKLLHSHFWLHQRRKTSGGGFIKIYPLMDSFYGMGKSAFASAYLSLVAKFVRGIVGEYGDDGYKRILGIFSEMNGFNLSSDPDQMKQFLGDLLGARTFMFVLEVVAWQD